MDSVVFALLAVDNPYLTHALLKRKLRTSNMAKKSRKRINRKIKVKNALVRLTLSIRQNKDATVKRLKKGLKSCPISKGGSNFSGYEQEDAGEFLQYLAGLFDLYPARVTTTTWGTNSLGKTPKPLVQTSSIVDNKASIVHTVPFFQLHSLDPRKSHRIGKLLKLKDDSGPLSSDNTFKAKGQEFSRRIYLAQVEDSPYLVFYLIRQNPFGTGKSTRKVLPTKQITLPSKRVLKLSGIVVHLGASRSFGHYVLYFRCGKRWFLYNDMPGSIVLLGNYQDMLKHEFYGHRRTRTRKRHGKHKKTIIRGPGIGTVLNQGTLYFYT